MLLAVLSVGLAVLVALPVCYLLVLTLFSRRPAADPPATPPRLRFTVIVPAHDEATMIAATVGDLVGLEHPRELFRVVVVADNCTDETASLARAAGARVLERSDAERRGKGYALDFAFSTLLEEGETDAFVVVDADTTVVPHLLRAFETHLATGARAVQGRYGVRNVDASWRTRLMAVALGMFHDLRSLARERLRLSCGLRGNGMCFLADTLRAHPHRAHGLVEDVEFGLELGLAGVRVAYAHEAEVRGEMAPGRRAAATQRNRWEGGRRQLRRAWLGRLLHAAWRRRDRLTLDLALDLATPPLSWIALGIGAGAAIETTAWLALGAPTPAVWIWSASALALSAYVTRGVVLSGLGRRGFATLALAPAYVLWRLVSRRSTPAQWQRTERA